MSERNEKKIKAIVESKAIQVYDWEEETSSRELKSIKGAVVKEFKTKSDNF